MLKTVQRIAIQNDAGPASGVVPAKIAFGSHLPSDLSTTVATVATLLTAKGLSRASGLRLLVEAGMDLDDAQRELDRIRSEDTTGAVEVQKATAAAYHRLSPVCEPGSRLGSRSCRNAQRAELHRMMVERRLDKVEDAFRLIDAEYRDRLAYRAPEDVLLERHQVDAYASRLRRADRVICGEVERYEFAPRPATARTGVRLMVGWLPVWLPVAEPARSRTQRTVSSQRCESGP